MTKTFSSLKLCEKCGNTKHGDICIYCGTLTDKDRTKCEEILKCTVCGKTDDLLPVHFKDTQTKWFCESHYRIFIIRDELRYRESDKKTKNDGGTLNDSHIYRENIAKIKSLLR